ncbi:hypothetical protein GVAV_000838 [Gurleya vavrai]
MKNNFLIIDIIYGHVGSDAGNTYPGQYQQLATPASENEKQKTEECKKVRVIEMTEVCKPVKVYEERKKMKEVSEIDMKRLTKMKSNEKTNGKNEMKKFYKHNDIKENLFGKNFTNVKNFLICLKKEILNLKKEVKKEKERKMNYLKRIRNLARENQKRQDKEMNQNIKIDTLKNTKNETIKTQYKIFMTQTIGNSDSQHKKIVPSTNNIYRYSGEADESLADWLRQFKDYEKLYEGFNSDNLHLYAIQYCIGEAGLYIDDLIQQPQIGMSLKD